MVVKAFGRGPCGADCNGDAAGSAASGGTASAGVSPREVQVGVLHVPASLVCGAPPALNMSEGCACPLLAWLESRVALPASKLSALGLTAVLLASQDPSEDCRGPAADKLVEFLERAWPRMCLQAQDTAKRSAWHNMQQA